MILLIVALVLLLAVIILLDPRVPWPKPNDRTPRYVSVAERSSTLRRD